MSNKNKFSSLDVMKKDTEEYGGYSNYPTWATSLWLDNEMPSNEYLYKLANSDKDVIEKVDELSNYVEYYFIDDFCSPNGLGCDLLGYALERINWREIIESHKEL